MSFHHFPRSAEFAERAYTVLQSNGELARIAEENAPAPSPAAFKARPDEEQWLRTGPLAEVADYLRAKFPTG